MDIYGAFQVCSIAILAAPLTVRLSKTYFYDPGRNLIFLWTGLILAGLLALAVEFYRVTPIDCPEPVHGGKNFPYGIATCGLICAEGDPRSPFSPLRAGPAANIGVIPVPTILTFNTGMLLATACCIPAVISLIFTFDKILALHWKRRFGPNEQAERNRSIEPIEGTNGATEEHMDGINGAIRRVLSVIEIPLFSAAILAILIAGEINFFSHTVRWETEPIASVGQWGPIAGTVLAALGSLYVLAMTAEEDQPGSPHHTTECTCGNQLQRQPTFTLEQDGDCSPSRTSLDDHSAPMQLRRSRETFVTDSTHPRRSIDPAGRRRVAEMLQMAGDKLGSAAHNKYDAKQYNNSKAREFPEIPGEAARNPELNELKRQYSLRRDVVLREENSRAASPSASNLTFPDIYTSPSTSPVLGQHGFSESPDRMATRLATLDVPPLKQTSHPDLERGRTPARRATLEVPSPTKATFSVTERDGLPARRATLEVPPTTQSNQDGAGRDRIPARRATLEVPNHRPAL
jgi:hypothetical protein